MSTSQSLRNAIGDYFPTMCIKPGYTYIDTDTFGKSTCKDFDTDKIKKEINMLFGKKKDKKYEGPSIEEHTLSVNDLRIAKLAADHIDEQIKDEFNKIKSKTDSERWVWVDGYKATDKDMCCRDFQYTMDELYDMPDESTVVTCSAGFHMCLTLSDVFKYYAIGNGHRFFKVKALVREKDLSEYGKATEWLDTSLYVPAYISKNDKLAARSIKFIEELTIDEILSVYDPDLVKMDEKYKRMAIETTVGSAYRTFHIDELVALGYSIPFAEYIYDNKRTSIAKAVASQPDMSMDMRALFILKGC